MSTGRGEKTPEELVAESRRIIAEMDARAKTAPPRPLPRNPHWHDSPAYERTGISLPVRPGFSWLLTVRGERAEAPILGRREVADGGTPAMLVRFGGRLLALRYEGDPDGWGTHPYTAAVRTQDLDVPVLAWEVDADAEPLPAPANPWDGVLVRPVPFPGRDRGGAK